MNFNFVETAQESVLETLADLEEGESAVLTALRLPPHTAEHLMWLGFVPGVEIAAGKSGPGGDPRVYTVSGSAFALRRATARQMLIAAPDDGVQE
jgi:Fe2+ transport system protein FeoA